MMQELISRQAAIDAVMALMPSLTTADGSGQFDAEIYRVQELFIDIGQVLNDLLPAEVEPVKHGRWIVVSDGYGNGDATAHICECSECKDTIWVYKKATRRWNYCPNCGAKMDLGGEAHEQN